MDGGVFGLEDGCGLSVKAAESPLMAQTEADFRSFCGTCMGVELGSGDDEGAIRWEVTGDLRFDPLDPACESFVITVAGSGIVVQARHERGLAHGVHYLERMMADCGEAAVPHGVIERSPRFAPRISSVWGGDERQFEGKLALAAHFGTSALHTVVHLFECGRNGIIPELNGPAIEETQAALRAKVELLARYGLDLYLDVNTAIFPTDHPAFAADPSRAGAPYRVFDDMKPQCVLCSSNEAVLSAHEAAIEDLYRSVPGLGGAIFLIGGEGLMHCYTRPYGPRTGYTSCPHCAGTAPAGAVAGLVNRMAAAVKRTGEEKAIFTWPYSAFTWSGEDRAQLAFIEQLSPEVQLLSNFDTNSADERNGAGVVLYDYNIKSVGPSGVFREQARRSRELGREIYAKTESNTTPSAYFTSYIPVHFRWAERFQAMAAAGAKGYMNQWFFYGLTGGPPEEMQYHAVWNPERKAGELLATLARRDFGVSRAEAEQAVAGWRLLSDAWDDFPYSAMTAGEREFYSRGPFFFGPAHPMIFNTQSRYGLSEAFFGLSGDLVALATPAELVELLKNAKPRYVSELLLTLPYGVERYLALLGSCRRQWGEGLRLLEGAIGGRANERARMELDICTLFDIHLKTLENVVRFYAVRDKLWRGPVALEDFAAVMDELAELLSKEIANAERSLPIVERDFRIRPYDAEMVREKVRQCRYVLEEELPMFDINVRFHVWNSAK